MSEPLKFFMQVWEYGKNVSEGERGIFITEKILDNRKSLDAVDFWCSQVRVWSPAHHQGRVAPHQGERHPLEQLLDGDVFLDSLMAG